MLYRASTEITSKIHHGHYEHVLPHVRANLILTSPPYNIGSKAPRQDGLRKFGGYDIKSYGAIRDYDDAMPEADYQDSQVRFLCWVAEHLAERGVLVYNHKPRHRNKILLHPLLDWISRPEVKAALTLRDEIVWDRGSTHNFCRQHVWKTTERLWVFTRVGDPYQFENTPDLKLSDVWRIPLEARSASSLGHACPFPLELAKRVLKAWSAPGDMVCDPYSGAGTTALAAQELGRLFEGAEIEERYVERSRARLLAPTEFPRRREARRRNPVIAKTARRKTLS